MSAASAACSDKVSSSLSAALTASFAATGVVHIRRTLLFQDLRGGGAAIVALHLHAVDGAAGEHHPSAALQVLRRARPQLHPLVF